MMRYPFFVLALVLLAAACGGNGPSFLNRSPTGGSPAPGTPTPTVPAASPTPVPPTAEAAGGGEAGQPLKVAFIGDQGLGGASAAVLQLIKDEGASLVLHQGDFDYEGSPEAWGAQIDAVLGPDFPYFASAGNHDECCIEGYQQVMQTHLDRMPGARCEGQLIVQATCTYRGLYMVFVAPDVAGAGHDTYIRDQLALADSIWRICSWHKVMAAMNVGGKGDESGWGVYEACREGGGIVATGHEHSYGRTHLMSSFEAQQIVSTASPLVIDEGQTFAFHSGLGGQSIREQEQEGGWWAAVYTSTQGADYGALFCTFFDGPADHASCYFKDISGRVADQFEMVSAVGIAP